MMGLGVRLRGCREKKGWTQTYVSERTGISNANISNYEREIREPDAETMHKFSELYGVTLDYLISGEDKKSSNSGRIAEFEDLVRSTGGQIYVHGKHVPDDVMNKVINYIYYLMDKETRGKEKGKP